MESLFNVSMLNSLHSDLRESPEGKDAKEIDEAREAFYVLVEPFKEKAQRYYFEIEEAVTHLEYLYEIQGFQQGVRVMVALLKELLTVSSEVPQKRIEEERLLSVMVSLMQSESLGGSCPRPAHAPAGAVG